MEVFGKDLIFGDFRASDFNLILTSMSSEGVSDDEMGNDMTIQETFIGSNPVPVYLSHTYSEKLRPTVTLSKNPCNNKNNTLDEFELRHILRLVTGNKAYKWMKVVTEDISEDTWYRAKVTSTQLHRVGNIIDSITLTMECDSQFGWSPEMIVTKNASAGTSFWIINNSDDLNEYLLPKVVITASTGGEISITNSTDIIDGESWTTTLSNVSAGETITMDSHKGILTSTVEHDTSLLDDFNLHWIRFVPGKNILTCDSDMTLKFIYRLPRKGGFLCR